MAILGNFEEDSLGKLARAGGNTPATLDDINQAAEEFSSQNIPKISTVELDQKVKANKETSESAINSSIVSKKLALPGSRNPLISFNAEIVEIIRIRNIRYWI